MKLKYWMLRKLYQFTYWFGQLGEDSDILYGYYRKFKRPEDVLNEELASEIKRLGKAIQEAI